MVVVVVLAVVGLAAAVVAAAAVGFVEVGMATPSPAMVRNVTTIENKDVAKSIFFRLFVQFATLLKSVTYKQEEC